ncbi:ABC transporter ATP-binding protein [[Clostridium] innocuum]|nr:ABC transporter ATP-binding protein [[Clostridium] innocuum]
MDALMLKNVSKAYENFQLKNISFTLPEGTIMGLIGENGAGKSTIINCIMDLVKRDSGEITVLGQQMNKDNLALREDIGIVFDVSDFYDSFSMEHTEKILQDVYKSWDHETFQKYKQQFALPDKKRMKEFSRGMKMKTAIAIALSHKPRLLILDEATSGLDPVMRDEILDVFLEFVQDEHHSILLSSHISTDLEKVADYITFLHDGELVLSACKDELIYQYGIMKCREEDFKQLDPDAIIRYRKQPYETVVLVADRKAAAHNYPNCIVERATLDDIMLLYVKGERI